MQQTVVMARGSVPSNLGVGVEIQRGLKELGVGVEGGFTGGKEQT